LSEAEVDELDQLENDLYAKLDEVRETGRLLWGFVDRGLIV
jgi:hypothetical protein